MRAYLFPGQGSQFTGMGKEEYETSAVARDLLDHKVTGLRLHNLSIKIKHHEVLLSAPKAPVTGRRARLQDGLVSPRDFDEPIIVAVIVMMWAARPIGDFVERHPTIKILALSFLILIGFALVGEGIGLHIPKGYIYFAMAFSLLVELLNMRMRGRAAPVKLHNQPSTEPCD